MDKNNNTNNDATKLDGSNSQAIKQGSLENESIQNEKNNCIKNEDNNLNQNQIELHAKYDASDNLEPDSGTQTPIEDEQSNHEKLVIDRSYTNVENDIETNSNPNNDTTKQDKSRVVCVKESEADDLELIEIELEADNTILLTSLTSLFPEATGLKYRHPETNLLRGVKLADGKFIEPTDGWKSVSNYICVFNRGSKRKAESEDNNSKNKQAKTISTEKLDEDTGSDLIVLGLAWTTTEATMRSYFEQYGEVSMVQIKTEKSGKSKGFGFVRFAKSSIQSKILDVRHFIDGRWCDVKVPLSKAEADATKAAQLSRKVFVGRLPDNITTDDLRNHFSSFGTLTDVFIPKPFRKFAFVTFGTSDMAQSIFKHKHVIDGNTVQISEAIPRDNAPNSYGFSGPQGNSNTAGYGPNYGAVNNTNIHPFNNSYSAQAAHHYHGSKAPVANFGANVYPGNRKQQHPQQNPYYQMPSYGTSGQGSGSMDTSSYMTHGAHNDYTSFGSVNNTSGYNQTSGNVNGGQYYKLQQQQQHQVMTQQHPNHSSTYPPQSSYSGHSANFSRNSYQSIWK